MGMFDWVNYECICPQCKGKVTGFQSKDSKNPSMERLQPEDVKNFYSLCKKCGCWLDIVRDGNVCKIVVSGKDGKSIKTRTFILQDSKIHAEFEEFAKTQPYPLVGSERKHALIYWQGATKLYEAQIKALQDRIEDLEFELMAERESL